MARPGPPQAWGWPPVAGEGRRGPSATAGLRDLRKLGLWGEEAQILHEPLGEGVRLGVALEMADRVSASDRIGLAEQVVAQTDLRIRVGAADLLQGRPGAVPHLVGRDTEQRSDVLVPLPPFEEQLKHRALFVSERHGRGSVGQGEAA